MRWHNWTGSAVDATPPYELTNTLQCFPLWLGIPLHRLTCAVTIDTTENNKYTCTLNAVSNNNNNGFMMQWTRVHLQLFICIRIKGIYTLQQSYAIYVMVYPVF